MMTQSSAAITARGIRKSFGEHTVLDDVDLEVDQGTIFALLGPNGAGKTTIVRILSTLIPADAGTIRVAGHDLAFLRNYPAGQWITRERERLTRAIGRAAGEDTGTPGMSR
jgi:ABC-type sugar transport system ATPase subunit